MAPSCQLLLFFFVSSSKLCNFSLFFASDIQAQVRGKVRVRSLNLIFHRGEWRTSTARTTFTLYPFGPCRLGPFSESLQALAHSEIVIMTVSVYELYVDRTIAYTGTRSNLLIRNVRKRSIRISKTHVLPRPRSIHQCIEPLEYI